jgi:hypothetical protein
MVGISRVVKEPAACLASLLTRAFIRPLSRSRMDSIKACTCTRCNSLVLYLFALIQPLLNPETSYEPIIMSVTPQNLTAEQREKKEKNNQKVTNWNQNLFAEQSIPPTQIIASSSVNSLVSASTQPLQGTQTFPPPLEHTDTVIIEVPEVVEATEQTTRASSLPPQGTQSFPPPLEHTDTIIIEVPEEAGPTEQTVQPDAQDEAEYWPRILQAIQDIWVSMDDHKGIPPIQPYPASLAELTAMLETISDHMR